MVEEEDATLSIVIGVISGVAVLIIIAVAFFCYRKKAIGNSKITSEMSQLNQNSTIGMTKGNITTDGEQSNDRIGIDHQKATIGDHGGEL